MSWWNNSKKDTAFHNIRQVGDRSFQADIDINGEIDLAIKTYEKNIAKGYPAHHSFKRLAILYRKRKDYNSEIRVIERALEIMPNDTYYTSRLEKTQSLRGK